MRSGDSILYVDDDNDACQLMTIWLSEFGDYKVTAIDNGPKASRLIECEGFDLYLLDYCLPDITGVGLCRQIRDSDARTPIIIYSALNRDIDREMAMGAGANLFLVKPDDLELVVPSIDNLLHHSSAPHSHKTAMP